MITHALPEHAERISELDGLLFPAESFNEHTVLKEIEAGTGLVYLSEEKIVGYALTRKQEDLVDLTRIGIHPDFQRQGIGELLLQAVIALADPRDVMLFVRKKNMPAIRLYQKNGFQVAGMTKDSWVMRR